MKSTGKRIAEMIFKALMTENKSSLLNSVYGLVQPVMKYGHIKYACNLRIGL